MRMYAHHPWRLAGQVSADVFVLVWAVAWWLVGGFAERAILSLAGPARQTSTAAGKLTGELRQLAEQSAKVPGVGQRLSQPFDAASRSVVDVIGAADHQVANLERLAVLVGWLVFLIPVAVIVALWLPRRLGFLLRARAAQGFLDSRADLDLFALRAMTSQPLHVLAKISADPVAAWRAGDATVIHKLAEIELRRNGLRMPTLAPLEATTHPEPVGEG